MLADQLKQYVPTATVDGAAGRASSFEVTVDGKLAFSKFAVGSFPKYEALAKEIGAYAQSGAVPASWTVAAK